MANSLRCNLYDNHQFLLSSGWFLRWLFLNLLHHLEDIRSRTKIMNTTISESNQLLKSVLPPENIIQDNLIQSDQDPDVQLVPVEIARRFSAKYAIREEALREIKATHTRWARGETSANSAITEMEAIAVSVWQKESM